MNSRERILALLEGRVPDRAVFAPNIWQWFDYNKMHGRLPGEIAGCETQVEVLKHLGVDIFSRNLLSETRRYWIGGHVETVFDGLEVEENEEGDLRRVTYRTPAGEISEVFRFDREGCTLIQQEHLFKDFDSEYRAWKSWLEGRRYVFDRSSFEALEAVVGEDGLVMVGETFCPLKQLHVAARADNAIYLLFDHEKEMVELMEIHERQTLELIRGIVAAGARVVCSMDNLDSFFYPPDVFDKYCAGFYGRAAEICHAGGASFFVHACGRQKDILSRVVDCGIDGLEGIAFPPLGDVELDQARKAGERFIVEGGLSAVQLEGEVSQAQADRYVAGLFEKMRPFDRFIFSMSCNTSILTSWDTLRRFRDAWLKFA